jgi:hypothetical protein
MTQEELIDYLSGLAQQTGSQSALALKLGISPQLLSDILIGTRRPGPKLMAALGFTRLTLYIPSEPVHQLGTAQRTHTPEPA